MKKLVVLFVVVATVFIVGACKAPNVDAKSGTEEEIDYSIHVASMIKEKKDCGICGSNERSMMDYYKKSGMIGLVCLNTMDISNLDARLYSDDGAEVLEPEKDGNSIYNTYGKGELSVKIDGMESRGIFEASISYGENSEIDFDKIKEFLCQDCLDKVAEMYKDCMEWTDGKGKFPQVCLVDFTTNELYSIASHELAYSIRDFWVHIDHHDDEDKVMVVYAPKNKMNQ